MKQMKTKFFNFVWHKSRKADAKAGELTQGVALLLLSIGFIATAQSAAAAQVPFEDSIGATSGVEETQSVTTLLNLIDLEILNFQAVKNLNLGASRNGDLGALEFVDRAALEDIIKNGWYSSREITTRRTKLFSPAELAAQPIPGRLRRSLAAQLNQNTQQIVAELNNNNKLKLLVGAKESGVFLEILPDGSPDENIVPVMDIERGWVSYTGALRAVIGPALPSQQDFEVGEVVLVPFHMIVAVKEDGSIEIPTLRVITNGLADDLVQQLEESRVSIEFDGAWLTHSSADLVLTSGGFFAEKLPSEEGPLFTLGYPSMDVRVRAKTPASPKNWPW